MGSIKLENIFEDVFSLDGFTKPSDSKTKEKTNKNKKDNKDNGKSKESIKKNYSSSEKTGKEASEKTSKKTGKETDKKIITSKDEEDLANDEALIKFSITDNNDKDISGTKIVKIDSVLGFAGMLKILERSNLNDAIENYQQLVVEIGKGGNYYGIKMWSNVEEKPEAQPPAPDGQPPVPEAEPEIMAVLMVDGSEIGTVGTIKEVGDNFNKRFFEFKKTLKVNI
jgi:hypothetical protein